MTGKETENMSSCSGPNGDPVNFTEAELSTIANALRVARDRFIEDAEVMRAQPGEAFERLARQFDKQHAETEALAVRIAEEEGY